jgi:hypothetical protein
MDEDLTAARRSSFARYWAAAAISSFGSAVTAVAMPVLVIQLLKASPLEVGIVNASQFVPYALSVLSPASTQIVGVASRSLCGRVSGVLSPWV